MVWHDHFTSGQLDYLFNTLARGALNKVKFLPCLISIKARSVNMSLIQSLPVSGRLHLLSNIDTPCFEAWVMAKRLRDMWGQCKLNLSTIFLLIPRPSFRPFALTDFCPEMS